MGYRARRGVGMNWYESVRIEGALLWMQKMVSKHLADSSHGRAGGGQAFAENPRADALRRGINS